MLAQKQRIVLCAVISFVLTAFHVHAAQVTLSWTAPTTNQNNTPLTDLAGYKVYHGLASRSYDITIDVGLTPSAVFSDLQDGRANYYFAVTAYDTSVIYSLFTEVQYTISLADTDGDGLTDTDEAQRLPYRSRQGRYGRRWHRCLQMAPRSPSGGPTGTPMRMAMAPSTSSMPTAITMAVARRHRAHPGDQSG